MISYYWWIFCFSSFSASFTDDNKKHPLCQTISINLIANWRLTADSKNLTAYSMPHTKGWSSIQDDWWTRLQWWKHGQNKICKLCSDKWEMLVAINNRENVSLSNCRKLWLETDKQVFFLELQAIFLEVRFHRRLNDERLPEMIVKLPYSR